MKPVLPPGPYTDLAAKVGGIGLLAKALKVDRKTVREAAKASRWLTGEPGVRLKALCNAYKITIPDGMKPTYV